MRAGAAIFLTFGVLAASPARAAGLLPIAVGDYAESVGDCGGPAALGWTGKGFQADYVYVDNIVKVEKTGPGQFTATSRTKTEDGNTQKSGRIWRANVRILSPTSFTFTQYAATSATREAPRTYSLCAKT